MTGYQGLPPRSRWWAVEPITSPQAAAPMDTGSLAAETGVKDRVSFSIGMLLSMVVVAGNGLFGRMIGGFGPTMPQ